MNQIVKVFSHPRSGTNLLRTLMKKNLYHDMDVSSGPGQWGHWSNRVWKDGDDQGQLSGYHQPRAVKGIPAIYIYRDGRAVCLSVWRSKNFNAPDLALVPFSDFLQAHMDWAGTPGARCEPVRSIVEHWQIHVISWMCIHGSNVFPVRFEELVTKPKKVIREISEYFNLQRKTPFEPVTKLVGPSPNEGKIDSWKRFFTDEDLDYFHSIVPEDSPYLWSDK